MKKNKKIAYALIGTLIMSTALSGCGKKKEEEKKDTALNITPTATMGDAEDIAVYTKEGCILNDFSGEWIDEKFENKRALCIMINNLSDAMPQSGIQKADVTFEFPVEGGITRYLCVFQDYTDLEKLGPIRSARHYYVYTAIMLDAYYAHYGWSVFAEDAIKTTGMDNLNGLTLDGIMYYRDNSRNAPHNVYTNSDMIQAGLDSMGYRDEHTSSYDKMFKFNTKDANIGNGTTANKVSVSFSSYQNPWFEYNKEEGVYYRFQYGGKQIDDNTGEQLHYKNVLIMGVEMPEIVDGLLDADLYSGGEGYYATNGEYESIKWKRDGDVIKFYTEDGEQLKMNPGNTFVEVMRTVRMDTISFE